MDGAFCARGFLASKDTPLKSHLGILREGLAFFAETLTWSMGAFTIDLDHGKDRLPLAGEAFAGERDFAEGILHLRSRELWQRFLHGFRPPKHFRISLLQFARSTLHRLKVLENAKTGFDRDQICS